MVADRSREELNAMLLCGIDPGLTGAIAVLDADGALIDRQDVPILVLRTARGTRQEYDLPGLVALLRPFVGAGMQALLEESQVMPGQGVRSMFTVGVGFGVWLGVLAALGLPYTRVRPADWKRTYGLVLRFRISVLVLGLALMLKWEAH